MQYRPLEMHWPSHSRLPRYSSRQWYVRKCGWKRVKPPCSSCLASDENESMKSITCWHLLQPLLESVHSSHSTRSSG